MRLSGHLSKKIIIYKGTEQGHPLSPELFKIFVSNSDFSPLQEYISYPYFTNASPPPPPPPSSQFHHGINMMPRSTNIAEGWHHGFNTMLSCNHSTLFKSLEALKKEQNLTRMQLKELVRQAAKWIRYDDRIQKLCSSFNRQTNVVNFLKKVAYVC